MNVRQPCKNDSLHVINKTAQIKKKSEGEERLWLQEIRNSSGELAFSTIYLK